MRLKIGAILFDVVEVDGLKDCTNSRIDGRIRHNDCIIEIDSSLAPQTKRQVLWHEVLHSLILQTGEREHDEGLIEALSFGIMGALSENKILRRKGSLNL